MKFDVGRSEVSEQDKELLRQLAETATKVLRERRRLYQKEGRDPGPAEVAARSGIPVARVEQVLSMVQDPISLDVPIGDENEPTVTSTRVELDHGPTPFRAGLHPTRCARWCPE